MKIHIIRPKDTLCELAKKYNVPVERMIEANPEVQDEQLPKIGSKFFIPTGKVSLAKKIPEVPSQEQKQVEDRVPTHQEAYFPTYEQEPTGCCDQAYAAYAPPSPYSSPPSYPSYTPEAMMQAGNSPYPSYQYPPVFSEYWAPTLPNPMLSGVNPYQPQPQQMFAPMPYPSYAPYPFLPYSYDPELMELSYDSSYYTESFASTESYAEPEEATRWISYESSSVEG